MVAYAEHPSNSALSFETTPQGCCHSKYDAMEESAGRYPRGYTLSKVEKQFVTSASVIDPGIDHCNPFRSSPGFICKFEPAKNPGS